MPAAHQEFVEAVETEPSIRDYVENSSDELRDTYNDCIDQLVTFRDDHIDIVAKYISGPLDKSKGTGGTPFSRYLETFTDDTEESRLSSPSQ
ncbi:hypothetical protein ACFFQF_33560 [Haladaptatus pallidirubidus]